MKIRQFLIPGAIVATVAMSAGCFGPFKKKSGGGGGGGGAPAPTAEKTVEGEEKGKSSTSPASGEEEGSEGSSPAAGLRAGYGCLQGVVIDGYTGQPIALADPKQLFVLIRGQKLEASKVDDANLVGQYYICNIPLDETYSVFGFLEGYQNFEGTVNVASTVGARTGASNAINTDIVKKDPIVISNIVLFPKTAGTRDLVVRVYNRGAVVEGAMVDLEPVNAGSNHFSVDGSTLAYSNGTRNFPQRVTTDADGKATFASDKISLGTNYNIRVTPPTTLDVSFPATQTITLGVGTGIDADDHNNYMVNFEVSDANKGLQIIACSSQAESYNSAGRLMYIFNRDIELSRNDDDWVATLGGATNATLAANAAGDTDAETMTSAISGGNMLILTPVWQTQPKTPDYEKLNTDPANDDLNAVVTYPAGVIKIKPAGEPKNSWTALNAVTLGAGVGSCAFNTRLFKSRE